MKRLPYDIFLAADKGGSGSAVLEGPIAPENPSSAPAAKVSAAPPAKEPAKEPDVKEPDPARSELDDFEPPSLDSLEEGYVPPAKKEDPKVDPKKTADPKQQKDPPAKQLRDELENVKKERDEWKTKYEAHPRVKELDEAVKSKETELGTLKKQVEEMRRELTMRDPAASEKVQKLASDFDAEFAAGIESVPALESQYRSLLNEFSKLPRDDRAKYQEALEEFETKVQDLVGERKTESALALIRRGAKFIAESTAAKKEAAEHGEKFIAEARAKEYDSGVNAMKEHLAGAFAVDETFADANPYHPLNFVLNARNSLDDAGKATDKEFEAKIDKYMTFAGNGPSPRTLAELDLLPPEEKQAKIASINGARMEAAKVIRQQAKRSWYYERMLSSVLKDYASMKEQLQKYSEAAPSDPTKRVGESGGSDSIEDFKAPLDELRKL